MAPAEPAVTTVIDDSRGRSRRRVALGVAVVGTLTLAGAGATGLVARARWKEGQDTGCVEERCRDQVSFDKATRARQLGIASEVLVGVSAAALVTAVGLWWTAPGPTRSRSVVITPTASPGSLGISAVGSF